MSYEYKYVPKSSFDGYGESCVKGGLFPFVFNTPQVVIPGSGDRSFAAISDSEIGIGMPAELVFYVLENLFKTGGNRNLGFPQKTFLATNLNENITPGFRYLREAADKKK
jgi:hypothetical protein